MPDQENIVRAADSGTLMRSKARTFFLASRFLPQGLRRDVRLVYAYYRSVDDLVDEPPPGWDETKIDARLQSLDDQLSSKIAPSADLIHNVLAIGARYNVPPHLFRLVIEGARFDLEARPIQTIDDLKQYSVLVAGSVGMVMAHILGAQSAQALQAASKLGVGMQLTNVLRDIGEDVQRGRVYLPSEEMNRAGCTLDDLEKGVVTESLRVVMQRLIEEAREMYSDGIAGIKYLDRSATFPVYLAARLYARLLDKIEQQDFDVFSYRTHLGRTEKWRATPAAYLEYRRLVRHTETAPTGP